MEKRVAPRHRTGTIIFKCLITLILFVLIAISSWFSILLYDKLLVMDKTIELQTSLLNGSINITSLIIAFYAAILALTLAIGKYYDRDIIRWNVAPLVLVGLLVGVVHMLVIPVAQVILVMNANSKGAPNLISTICGSNLFIGCLLCYTIVTNMSYLYMYFKNDNSDVGKIV